MRFNLSEWALRNRTLVLYAMIVLGALGALSYSQLGQSEDPPFTFKVMVVNTVWPGASAKEVSRQVTERIEKKLMETGDYDRITSFSRPGQSQVLFMARDDMHSRRFPTSGTRCARRWATSATPCPRASRGRSSMTNSAPPSAISTPSPARASTTR